MPNPVGVRRWNGRAVGPNAVCQQCHTASDDWQSVSGIKFDNNVISMCNTVRHVVQVLGPSAFVSFLDSDPVVGVGFDGLRGMDENSPFWPLDPESPPMDRGEFVQRANAWVTQGKAQCGSGWNGSISYTQRFTSVSPGDDAGETTIIDIAVADEQTQRTSWITSTRQPMHPPQTAAARASAKIPGTQLATSQPPST